MCRSICLTLTYFITLGSVSFLLSLATEMTRLNVWLLWMAPSTYIHLNISSLWCEGLNYHFLRLDASWWPINGLVSWVQWSSDCIMHLVIGLLGFHTFRRSTCSCHILQCKLVSDETYIKFKAGGGVIDHGPGDILHVYLSCLNKIMAYPVVLVLLDQLESLAMNTTVCCLTIKLLPLKVMYIWKSYDCCSILPPDRT